MSESVQRVVSGRYAIESIVAEGDSGIVYAARDEKLRRPVTIKAVRKAGLSTDDIQMHQKLFSREVQASARLHHPNIAQVYDCGEDDEIVYVVVEQVNGSDLGRQLASGTRFAPAESVRIVRELLVALDCAHGAGVVHRDVKASNVMLIRGGGIKLGEFGLAHASDVDQWEDGWVVGTPHCMAPEQIRGEPVDHRADLFAAGILLYQLLSGRRPFQGDGFTLWNAILKEDPPPVSSIDPAVPTVFDAVVQRSLAKRREERYASAREFSDALQAALDGSNRSATRGQAHARGVEPYDGNEAFIFASYKREDFDRISPVLERIVDAGYRVWYDKGIPGSAEWAALLEDRLKACSLLVFFLSCGSVDSKYCRREINYVDSLNKPILCVRLEEAELKHGLDMLLTQYQIVDVANEDFPGEIERALKYRRLL